MAVCLRGCFFSIIGLVPYSRYRKILNDCLEIENEKIENRGLVLANAPAFWYNTGKRMVWRERNMCRNKKKNNNVWLHARPVSSAAPAWSNSGR
jgi:hypothetical protein